MTKKNIFECSAVINWCEIELTNHCYLDCIWCIRKECNDFWFMTFDIFKSVINNVEKIWYEEIVLSWLGDVFLHKDLYTFIDYIFFKIPNIKIYIMTKWQTLSIQDIDRFLEYKNNWFNIGLTFSIFSLSKKVYTSVTWWWNLVNLLDIIKYSYNKKINFSFEFLINKNNINSINNFKKFTKLFWKEFMYSIPHKPP